MMIQLVCERGYADCKGVAEGKVGERFVCRACLEYGEKNKFEKIEGGINDN